MFRATTQPSGIYRPLRQKKGAYDGEETLSESIARPTIGNNLRAAAFIVAALIVPAAAQSGRGRQLRIAERLNRQTSVSVSVPQDASPAAVGENRFSVPGNITNSRNARLIYHDDSKEHHPNRADKKAGWILLGVFALFIGAEIANDGDFWGPR